MHNLLWAYSYTIAIVLLDPMVQVLKLADKEVENRTTRQRRTAVAKCFV